jgi:hypothetical protein
MKSRILRSFLLFAVILLPLIPLKAQDTLFFRDGTFSIARLKKIDVKEVRFQEINEQGDSSLQKEKSERIDSICFANGSCYRKGKTGKGNLRPEAEALQSYWEGRNFGYKNNEFPRSVMMKSYISGLLIAGIPYPIYQSLKEPEVTALPTAAATRFRSDKAYADGYRKAVRKARLQSSMSMYFAGLISSLLVLSLLMPH